MDEVMSVRVEQWARLQSERADARRAAHANGQRVVELESELVQVRPVVDAAHGYCAAVEHDEDYRFLRHAELMRAHEATTPSRTPPTHVIVAVDELERLREIADAAGTYLLDQSSVLSYGQFRDAVDAYRSGAS